MSAVITWADFKRAVEAAGVKDDDVLGWIDYTPPGSVRVRPSTAGKIIDYAEK